MEKTYSNLYDLYHAIAQNSYVDFHNQHPTYGNIELGSRVAFFDLEDLYDDHALDMLESVNLWDSQNNEWRVRGNVTGVSWTVEFNGKQVNYDYQWNNDKNAFVEQ